MSGLVTTDKWKTACRDGQQTQRKIERRGMQLEIDIHRGERWGISWRLREIGSGGYGVKCLPSGKEFYVDPLRPSLAHLSVNFCRICVTAWVIKKIASPRHVPFCIPNLFAKIGSLSVVLNSSTVRQFFLDLLKKIFFHYLFLSSSIGPKTNCSKN